MKGQRLLMRLAAGVLLSTLSACGALTNITMPGSEPEVVSPSVRESCYGAGDLPDFTGEDCLLDEWVAFALQAQRGNSGWRESTLLQLEQATATTVASRVPSCSAGAMNRTGSWPPTSTRRTCPPPRAACSRCFVSGSMASRSVAV